MNSVADIQDENARRLEFERQREREKRGISGAAEAGVFSPGRPKELDVVAQRDAWMAEQWANEFRPQDHTVIPVFQDDGPPSDPLKAGSVVAADWDAPLKDLGDV